MGERLDRIRELTKNNATLRNVAENPLKDCPAPAVTTVTVPARKPSKAPSPKAPEKSPATPVKLKCGHETTLQQLADRNCAACKEKYRQARATKRKAKHEDRCEKKQDDRGRLPDNAVYHVAYDASRTLWSGVLEIPGCPVFTASASGVFRLLTKLDGMWRFYTKEMKPTEVKPCV